MKNQDYKITDTLPFKQEEYTKDEYETILWNYTTLKNKFYPKSN
jgi:hypothetical protein